MTLSTSKSFNPILFHIGYQKSGSTYLQNYVFNNPKAGFGLPIPNSRARIIEEFFFANPFRFDAHHTRAVFAKGCSDLWDTFIVPVFSDENLMGHHNNPILYGQIVADRIHATFPESSILICIREQKSLLYSLFSELITVSGTKKLDDFLGHRKMPAGALPGCRRDLLEYHELIKYYQDKFGPAQVKVLPYELMRLDLAKFVNEIIQFSSARPVSDFAAPQAISNKRHGGLTLSIRSFMNKFTPSPDFTNSKQPTLYKLNSKFSRALDLCLPTRLQTKFDDVHRQMIEERIGDTYSISNRVTSNLIDLDLSDYGYPCAPANQT
jgi:hypothetical protein